VIYNLLIVCVVVYAAYVGSRRGWVLACFELSSFVIATALALLSYRFIGAGLHLIPGFTIALGEVAGFLVIWIITELTCAIIVRFALLPKIPHHVHLSPLSEAGGAFFNGCKGLMAISLMLLVFAGSPLSAGTKQIVTDAAVPSFILYSSGQLQSLFSSGLGNDLNQSLNFFTVTNEPESEERILLGFTTTGKPDPEAEIQLLALLNKERTNRGLHPLTMNEKARVESRAYSEEMFAHGYFSHIDAGGHSPFDRMKAGGVKFDLAGENLALAPTVTLAHQGLMNSPGHRANILNSNYRTVGIGIVDGGQYGLMVTQDFTD
jgi:uncharacterized protein YkwD